MKRGWGTAILVPVLLATAGIALIVIGQSGSPEPTAAPSLSPIALPTDTPAASPSATTPISSPSPAAERSPSPEPTPTPLPDDVVAEQLQIDAVGLNVTVAPSTSGEIDDFPPLDGAYILQGSAQPGRNTNSYIFAHAREGLFLPLWNVRLGDQVLIRMSDGTVLAYVVTEVRPNIPCPDADQPPHPNPPLALARAAAAIGDGCEVSWLQPTSSERITLQTSQGPNRNYGEFIVIAEPAR